MANITSHGLRLNVAYMKKEQVEKIMMKIGGTGKGSSSSSFSLEIPTLSCYGEWQTNGRSLMSFIIYWLLYASCFCFYESLLCFLIDIIHYKSMLVGIIFFDLYVSNPLSHPVEGKNKKYRICTFYHRCVDYYKSFSLFD